MNIKKINIISDTHFRLSQSAFEALKGNFSPQQIYDYCLFGDAKFCKYREELDQKVPDLVIHAGDIGSQHVIDSIESIAPLIAVNGNCDFESYHTLRGFTEDLEFFTFEDVPIVVAHRPYQIEGYDAKLLIHGHTHASHITPNDNGSITICPGSASMGRYGTPNSIASVYVENGQVIFAELIGV